MSWNLTYSLDIIYLHHRRDFYNNCLCELVTCQVSCVISSEFLLLATLISTVNSYVLSGKSSFHYCWIPAVTGKAPCYHVSYSLTGVSLSYFSHDVTKNGFTVVLDMRQSKWDEGKPILKSLQVSYSYTVNRISCCYLAHWSSIPERTRHWNI